MAATQDIESDHSDDRHGEGVLAALSYELQSAERTLAADTRRNAGNMRASLTTLALTLVISVAMGVAAWAFLTSLEIVTGVRGRHGWLLLLLPAVGVGTAWVYRNHGLRSARGNNLVIDSALGGTPIHARMAFLTFACSVATHLVGGSAGREGTAVQIGGTIASNVAERFGVKSARTRQDLMLAGVSAAFGGVFGTPLAGAFFGMEVCTVGKLNYSAGIYCLIASFTGNAVADALGIARESFHIASIPPMDAASVILVVACACVFGLVARLFSLAIRSVKRLYGTRVKNYLVAALVGSLALCAVYFAFSWQRYAGLSSWLVEAGFEGRTSLLDPVAKLICTALTLGAGFQGGEVTPLFAIGASLGGWLGVAIGFDPSFMAALGMLGMFGAALNVPITTIMLAIDMFGGAGAPYFVILAFVSYLVEGHRGVYPAQRIVTPKRRSLTPDTGDTLEAAIARHHQAAGADEAPGGQA